MSCNCSRKILKIFHFYYHFSTLNITVLLCAYLHARHSTHINSDVTLNFFECIWSGAIVVVVMVRKKWISGNLKTVKVNFQPVYTHIHAYPTYTLGAQRNCKFLFSSALSRTLCWTGLWTFQPWRLSIKEASLNKVRRDKKETLPAALLSWAKWKVGETNEEKARQLEARKASL